MSREELVLTADAKELLTLRRSMEALLANSDFVAYQEVLRKSIIVWTELSLRPTDGISMLFTNEHAKGTLYGIRLILGLPERTIAEAKSLLRRQERTDERQPDFTRPGQHFDGRRSSFDSPDRIAEQLDVASVGPDARVTADSNTE